MKAKSYSIFNWALYILAALLSLVALISLAARWFIYDIEQYRGAIAAQISKTLKLDASIAQIDAHLDFLSPVVYAQQVKLTNPKMPNKPLAVEQLEVVIDLFSSLLNTEPRIQSIRMAGIELLISTDLNQSLLQLPQLDMAWNMSEARFDLKQLISKAVAVDYFDVGFHDVMIHWNDKDAAQTQILRVEDFILNPQYNETQLSLVAELPQTLGQKLTLIAALEHDISNPSSDFYIKTEDLNLANFDKLTGTKLQHRGRLHAELWAHASYQQGLENLTAALSLKDYLNLALDPNNTISSFETKLNWLARTHHRELGFAELTIQSDAATVQNADLAIVQRQEDNHYLSNLRFSADHLSPTLYNQLLAYAQINIGIEQSHSQALRDEQKLDLILQSKHTGDWFISPHNWPPMQALQSIPPANLPQISGGQLELALNDVKFNRHQWVAPQNLERIELKGSYQRNAKDSEWHLEHLYIKGSDSILSGNITYRIKDGKDKNLQSSLQLHQLAATEIIQWAPPQTLNPRLENWLRNAPRGGIIRNAELSINGNPDLPFREESGLWRLQAQAEDLNLLYRKQDPELREANLELLLENQHLKVRSNHLRTMDFYSKDTTVELEDITMPYVKINSRGRGPLADILSYVKTTNLVDPNSIVIANIETDGDVDMELEVHTRLSPNIERETFVGGHIDLDGAEIKLKTLDLDLKQLEGRLHFDRSGGTSDKLKAMLDGNHPLIATAEASKGATRLKIKTRIPFPVDDLQMLTLPKNTFNNAVDSWHAEVLIPPLRAGSEGALQLKLNSDLQALAVNMPAPLHKRAGKAIDSTLIANITNSGKDYQFDYGDRMRLTLQSPNDGTMTGSIHFSPRVAYPYEASENASFVVRGVIPYLSINEWRDWLQSNQGAATQDTLYAQDVDILIDKLIWHASTANQVHLTIKPRQDKTWVTLDSAEIKGNISIPKAQDKRVYMDLEHLILNGKALSSDSNINPADLPPMSIKIDRFKSGYYDIDDLKIVLSPDIGGVQITKLGFNKKDNDKILIQAQLTGDWTRIAGRDRSNFNFLLSSDDYGQLLRNWHFYSGLKGGRGQVSGQLLWDDSPLNFEIDQLQGPAKLQIKDGSIEAIEPGVGRLFGLLNINELARRLTLDFKDVFDKGFEFDRMQGNLVFNKADLMTQNLIIKGPALEMKISGRTGITQRDYDQKIVVTPHVGANVAVATAFLGGPLTAATVFLLSKVTELDEWIDKIITLEYTLQGSWDKPEVKFVSAPVAQKLDPTSTLKRTSKPIKSLLDKIFPKK